MTSSAQLETAATPLTALIRYGRIAEVARFELPAGICVSRGDRVVIDSPLGQIVGEVLDENRNFWSQDRESEELTGTVHRLATEADDSVHLQNVRRADAEFGEWVQRIREWQIDVELVDLEFTLDGRTSLYILNGRDAEPTKLALRAVTEHHGLIDVHPVSSEGVVPAQKSGCGSCGCH